MKLFGVTTTHNNSAIVPYVMKYVEEAGYDKFIVYDNESTDNTVALLSKYPFVEVRSFPHSNEWDNVAGKGDVNVEFNEKKRSMLLQGLWDLYGEHVRKKGGYVKGKTEPAWITLTDFDEVVYFSKQYLWNLKMYLEHIGRFGYNVCAEDMVNLLGEHLPYRTDEFVHRQVSRCIYGDPYDWKKPLLFRLDNLLKVTPSLGHHFMYIKFLDDPIKVLSNTRHLHVFHLKYAFGEGLYNNRAHNLQNVRTNMENSIRLEAYFEHKMLNGIVPAEENVFPHSD